MSPPDPNDFFAAFFKVTPEEHAQRWRSLKEALPKAHRSELLRLRYLLEMLEAFESRHPKKNHKALCNFFHRLFRELLSDRKAAHALGTINETLEVLDLPLIGDGETDYTGYEMTLLEGLDSMLSLIRDFPELKNEKRYIDQILSVPPVQELTQGEAP